VDGRIESKISEFEAGLREGENMSENKRKDFDTKPLDELRIPIEN
jgi:hypothetical protein